MIYVFVSLFIISLIVNQLIKCFSPKIIEGATGSKDKDSSCPKPPAQLALENAANINVIKQQLSTIQEQHQKQEALNTQIESNSYAVNKLTQKLTDQQKNIPDQKTQDKLKESAKGAN